MSQRSLVSIGETYLHFLQDDALGVRCTTEGIGLPSRAHVGLLVVFIRPSLLSAVVHVLARRANTTGLTWNTDSPVITCLHFTEIDTPFSARDIMNGETFVAPRDRRDSDEIQTDSFCTTRKTCLRHGRHLYMHIEVAFYRDFGFVDITGSNLTH